MSKSKFLYFPTAEQLNRFKDDVARLSRQVKYLTGQDKNFPKLKTLNGFSQIFFNKDFNKAKVEASVIESGKLDFFSLVDPSDCEKIYGNNHEDSIYLQAIADARANADNQRHTTDGMTISEFYELINKYNVYPKYPFVDDGVLPKSFTLFKRGELEDLGPEHTIDVTLNSRVQKFTVMSVGELGTTGEATISIQIGHWVDVSNGGYCLG